MCGSHHCCSGLTQSMVCGPPSPDCFPGVLEGLSFSFCLCIFCEEGKASFPSPLTFFSFFLRTFAFACACSTTEEFRLYCYFCVGTFCSFQTSTMDFFSKDLNCMSVPFSPENSDLAPLPLALFEILLYPGHSCFDLLYISWAFPGS